MSDLAVLLTRMQPANVRFSSDVFSFSVYSFQLVGLACLRTAMRDFPRGLHSSLLSEELLDPKRFAQISDDTYTPEQVQQVTEVGSLLQFSRQEIRRLHSHNSTPTSFICSFHRLSLPPILRSYKPIPTRRCICVVSGSGQ